MSVKFSILTATRNCCPYIAETIQSVLDQTHETWEMIISDDMSTDGTYEKACEIAAEHSNIIVTQNTSRLYCGANYSKILSMVSGKYCGVLDGDDKLAPEAMSTVIKYYENNPGIDFMWTKHKWGNATLTKFRHGLSCAPRNKNIYDSEKGLSHTYSHWRTFKTEMRDRGVLFRPIRCTVDKDLGYNLEELGRGAFLSKTLYIYRYHKSNLSHRSSQRVAWDEIRKYHKHKKRFNSIILGK